MRGFIEALRRHTCLDFIGPEQALHSTWDALRWLPAIGMLSGLLLAWLYRPLAEFLLPHEAALVAILGFQGFLFNFGPERALGWVLRQDRPTADGAATALLSLLVLAKFVLYRQFLAPDLVRAIVLGSTAAFTSPVLVALRMARPSENPDLLTPPPLGVGGVAWAFWIAVAALAAGAIFAPPGHAFRATACIVACTALAQIFGMAWLRDRFREGLPAPAALALALPSEVAACAGLLIARAQFI